MTFDNRGRAAAFSVQLTRAHDELRRRIRSLQANLGRAEGVSVESHCLAFCSALTSHHEGEDAGMFAALAEERPDLAGTIDKLVEDHEMIGTILQRVAELAASAARLSSSAAASPASSSASLGDGSAAAWSSASLGDGSAAASSSASLGDGRELARLKGELDGLAAIMESHFRFEERAVGAALDDGITDTGWGGPVFRPE